MEPIWFTNPLVLVKPSAFGIILPESEMSTEEKHNACIRFALYVSIILAVLIWDARAFTILVIAILISLVVYHHKKNEKFRVETELSEKKLAIVDNKLCRKSTEENPFMNVLITDYTENPRVPSACPVQKKEVKEEVENNYESRLFKDVGDLYHKNHGQRQFYTMPNTSIPNDQQTFAEWCYGTGPSCKEGNGVACYRLNYRYALN